MRPEFPAELEAIVEAVQDEWQMGGLGPDSMYGEFAMVVAQRWLATRQPAPVLTECQCTMFCRIGETCRKLPLK